MTGETGDSSWVNLLSDGVHALTPISKSSSVSRKRGVVTVSECTPFISRKVGAKEMCSSQLSYQTACQKLEQQAQLITTLMSDNATLVSQMELLWANKSNSLDEEQMLETKEQALQGLMAHIRNLRQEFKLLSSKFQSPPQTSSLLGDLERLTHKNADLCSALAATQYSRNILEREMIVLKRTLLKERSRLFTSSRDVPHVSEVKRIMDENVNLRKRLDQSQLKFEHVETEKKMQKEQLERLSKENMDLKGELENLRQSQLKEIDRRCKEVDNLKLQLSDQLDSLQKDHEMQSHKLTELTKEKNKLINRVHALEELKAKLTHQSGVLESRLSSVSSRAEQLESENLALRSRLAQVQRNVEENNPESHSMITDSNSRVESSLEHVDCSCEQQLCRHRFDLSSSPVCNQRPMPDVLNLKQQLADSRHHNVRLEVQLAQLKTDNAKLFGSYQAIVSIRNQLSQENTRLLICSKDFNSQKVRWLREKDDYQNRLDEMSAHTVQLDSNLSAMKDELHQVSELCKRRQDQLTEYANCVNCVDQLKAKLNCLQDLVAAEVDHLGTLTSENDNQSALLNQQVLDTVENIRICGAVNSTRICQIEMCDESVTRLQGELEVLRARKAVLTCVSKQQSVSNSFFPFHLTYDGCSGESKLRHKLKLQRKQINFLRVKLGYTLSELRLYKQLKEACDQQLSELEGCLEEVKRQHHKCAARLVAAEQQLDKHR